jgi:hypothetical protein
MTFVPPPPPEPPRPLDLAQRKDLGALLTSAWRIWRARPGLFLLTAMVVSVVPLAIERIVSAFVVSPFLNRVNDAIPDGTGPVNGDYLPGIEWSDATWPIIVTLAGTFVIGLLVPSLVTATHARAVVALAEGDDLSSREALRRGLAVFGSAIWSVAILIVLVLLGFAALLLPGLWLSIAGMFAATLPALGIARGFGAIRESARLVGRVGWWRTSGTTVVIYLVSFGLALIPISVIDAVIGSDDASVAVKIGGSVIEAVLQAAVMSWSALAITLLFFSMKARIGEAWVPTPGTSPIDLPAGGGSATGGGSSAGGGSAGGGPVFHRPGQAGSAWSPPGPGGGYDGPPHGSSGGYDAPPRFIPPGQRPPERDE